MARSTGAMTLFVQRTERENPLEIARGRSDLLRRNSSLLSRPLDARRVFEPEPGVFVKSKIEYVIYESLRRARDAGQLTFTYEDTHSLPFDEGEVVVYPDFTVIGDRRYYWEHLGMLDRDDYFADWQKRRRAYERKGLKALLLTSCERRLKKPAPGRSRGRRGGSPCQAYRACPTMLDFWKRLFGILGLAGVVPGVVGNPATQP